MPGQLHMNVSIGFADATREESVDLPDDWSEMDEDEQDRWCEETYAEFVDNYVEGGYVVTTSSPRGDTDAR